VILNFQMIIGMHLFIFILKRTDLCNQFITLARLRSCPCPPGFILSNILYAVTVLRFQGNWIAAVSRVKYTTVIERNCFISEVEKWPKAKLATRKTNTSTVSGRWRYVKR